MPFPLTPDASNKRIVAAGELLSSDPESISEAENARVLLSQWRAGHLLPLDAVAKAVQQRLVDLGLQSIVSLRLKRLYRIVDKLRQNTRMDATQMQDVAGVRVIARNVADVYTLAQSLCDNPLYCVGVGRQYDYVKSPKESGYRCVHFAFKYKGEVPSKYDGLRVELQIRSEIQHLWSSAVEVSGMRVGQRLKYDEGDPEWKEFFALTAEMIARGECTPSATPYVSASPEQLQERLSEVEGSIDALNVIGAVESELSVDGLASLSTDQPLEHSLLLRPDQSAMRVWIEAFPSERQDAAMSAYADAEQQVDFTDRGAAPVLVSVSSIESLRDAYRSFFMEIRPFASLVKTFISGALPLFR